MHRLFSAQKVPSRGGRNGPIIHCVTGAVLTSSSFIFFLGASQVEIDFHGFLALSSVPVVACPYEFQRTHKFYYGMDGVIGEQLH